jgi:hypothetical protein
VTTNKEVKMQRNSIIRISIVATAAIVVGGLLFAPSAPQVAASALRPSEGEGKSCSNRTLRGDYGASVEGVVLPAPGVSLPLRGVVMVHYDGNGNFTQVDHIVVNGQAPAIEWTPGTGTYQVNSDCTGTAHIVPSTGGFVNLEMVVVKSGKQINAVVTAPYDGPDRTVTSVATRVD